MTTAYIHLPIADWTASDLKLTGENLKKARDYFWSWARFHNITVKKKEDGHGLAAAFQNIIWVPTIHNLDDFWLCMHEVGHIVAAPRLSAFEPIWGVVVDEYESDMFAKKMFLKVGFSTELLEQHSKRVLFRHVRRMHKTKITWPELPERVTDILTKWLGITETDWRADVLRRADDKKVSVPL